MESSAALLDKTGKALQQLGRSQPSEDDDAEIQQLFEQPYIDPLTRFLNRHGDDESPYSGFPQVRQERDRRCAAVAERYSAGPLSAHALERYRGGYSFSCPQDVEAYAGQLKKQTAAQARPADSKPSKSSKPSESDRQEEPSKSPVADIPTQQLNDCYLLTAIRNFSEAQKACREPAEAGDIQALNNMAQIAYAYQDHAAAYRWAQQAAPASFEASFLLGQLYAEGKGVEQSSENAEMWYEKAASRGHAGAKAALVERSGAGNNVN